MPLPSTRLYWRMALYIGAALVAFVLLSLASVWVVARGELENYTATKHSGLGRAAARVLAESGRDGLVRWLDGAAAIPPDVTVYVLDGDSVDLRGQPLPRLYAGFVRRSVVGPAERPGDAYRPVRLAPGSLGGPGPGYGGGAPNFFDWLFGGGSQPQAAPPARRRVDNNGRVTWR